MVLKVCGDTKQSAFHELSIGEAEIEIFIDFKERFESHLEQIIFKIGEQYDK